MSDWPMPEVGRNQMVRSWLGCWTQGEGHYVWGKVIAWEPPHRVAFKWHPGRDEHAAQTVEVTFTETADGTDVMLTHSGFETLAEKAALTREGYNNGWEVVFNVAFREYVGQQH